MYLEIYQKVFGKALLGYNTNLSCYHSASPFLHANSICLDRIMLATCLHEDVQSHYPGFGTYMDSSEKACCDT